MAATRAGDWDWSGRTDVEAVFLATPDTQPAPHHLQERGERLCFRGPGPRHLVAPPQQAASMPALTEKIIDLRAGAANLLLNGLPRNDLADRLVASPAPIRRSASVGILLSAKARGSH